MTVSHALVVSIAGPLVLLFIMAIDLARLGVVVVLASRNCSSRVGKLVHIRRGCRHAHRERAEHYCQQGHKLAQNQHAALICDEAAAGKRPHLNAGGWWS